METAVRIITVRNDGSTQIEDIVVPSGDIVTYETTAYQRVNEILSNAANLAAFLFEKEDGKWVAAMSHMQTEGWVEERPSKSLPVL